MPLGSQGLVRPPAGRGLGSDPVHVAATRGAGAPRRAARGGHRPAVAGVAPDRAAWGAAGNHRAKRRRQDSSAVAPGCPGLRHVRRGPRGTARRRMAAALPGRSGRALRAGAVFGTGGGRNGGGRWPRPAAADIRDKASGSPRRGQPERTGPAVRGAHPPAPAGGRGRRRRSGTRARPAQGPAPPPAGPAARSACACGSTARPPPTGRWPSWHGVSARHPLPAGGRGDRGRRRQGTGARRPPSPAGRRPRRRTRRRSSPSAAR